MIPLESLFRCKNIDFFTFILSEKTVRSAAQRAGITQQHGGRLCKHWRNVGWIVQSSKEEREAGVYKYTESGREVYDLLLTINGAR